MLGLQRGRETGSQDLCGISCYFPESSLSVAGVGVKQGLLCGRGAWVRWDQRMDDEVSFLPR